MMIEAAGSVAAKRHRALALGVRTGMDAQK